MTVKRKASGDSATIRQGCTMEYKFPFNTTKKHLQKQDMKQDQEEQKIVEEGDQGTSKEWESVSNISDVDEEDAGGVIEQI